MDDARINKNLLILINISRFDFLCYNDNPFIYKLQFFGGCVYKLHKNVLLPRIDCNYAFSRMLKEFTNCHPSFADMSHIRILKRVDSNIKLPCFCAGNKLYFDRMFMYFQITCVSCLLYSIINIYVYEIPIYHRLFTTVMLLGIICT